MRKVFIAVALALSTLSACGLYFGESTQSNQQIPDANSSDGGSSLPDANVDAGNPTGCGDAGIYPPDAPDNNYPDAQPWYPDAAVDAH